MVFKIPKKYLTPRFSIRFFIWFISVLFLSLILIFLSILQGIKYYSQKNIIRNYNSHISIKSETYNKNTPKSLSSFWQEPFIPLLATTNQDFIRSITSRSILPALYISNTSSHPLNLIVIDTFDSGVFSNFPSVTRGYTSISSNGIHIGKDLAHQLKLEIGQIITLSIPSLELILTNIKIEYIYESPDPLNSFYNIFVSKESLDPFINNRFMNYHVRFSASPFYNFIYSNILPVISGQKYNLPDHTLKYQYDMIEQFEKIIIYWGYYFYIILAFIIFIIYFLYRQQFISEYKTYAYNAGILSPPGYNLRLLKEAFYLIWWISISSLIILALYLYINPPISSVLFISKTGLFQNFSFPLEYYFHSRIPIIGVFKIIIYGSILFLIIYSFLLVFYYKLSNIISSHNAPSYRIFGLIFILILGYLSVNRYFYYTSANKGRQKQWMNTYFGTYTLYDKDYLSSQFIGVPPRSFSLDPQLIKELISNDIPYLVSFNTFGKAFTISSNQKYSIKEKDIQILSLQGEYLPGTRDIISKISNNQILIGKDIGIYFLSNKLISLKLEKFNTNSAQITLPVHEIINLPIVDFNDTVFLNHNTLTKILSLPNNHITKLQVLDGKSILQKYTNQQIVLKKASESFHTWEILSDLVLFGYFICTLLHILIVFLLILYVYIYIGLYNKSLIIYNKIWGNYIKINKKDYFLCSLSFLIGIIFSKLNKVFYTFKQTNLPEFLLLPKLTYFKTPYRIDILAIFIIIVSYFIISLLIFLIYSKILKTNIKKLTKYINKDKI